MARDDPDRSLAHRGIFAASDFFSVEVRTPRGLIAYYVLLVFSIADLLVHITGITNRPDDEWMRKVDRSTLDSEDGMPTATSSNPRTPSDYRGDRYSDTAIASSRPAMPRSPLCATILISGWPWSRVRLSPIALLSGKCFRRAQTCAAPIGNETYSNTGRRSAIRFSIGASKSGSPSFVRSTDYVLPLA